MIFLILKAVSMKFAKIIRMDFNLGNLVHSALVSISGDAEDNFIHVQLLQSFFKKVFGVEHIRYRNQNGSVELEEISYPFMRDIANTINKNLNQHFSPSAASLWAIRD
jgi:hypothetical protein